MDITGMTFGIIKGPSVARGHTEQIIAQLEARDIVISCGAYHLITEDELRQLYVEHVDNPYYSACRAAMECPQVCFLFVAYCVEKDSVVALREVVGEFSNSQRCDVDTIRYLYGGFRYGSDEIFYADNAIHASDTIKDAQRECNIFAHVLKSRPKAFKNALVYNDVYWDANKRVLLRPSEKKRDEIQGVNTDNTNWYDLRNMVINIHPEVTEIKLNGSPQWLETLISLLSEWKEKRSLDVSILTHSDGKTFKIYPRDGKVAIQYSEHVTLFSETEIVDILKTYEKHKLNVK